MFGLSDRHEGGTVYEFVHFSAWSSWKDGHFKVYTMHHKAPILLSVINALSEQSYRIRPPLAPIWPALSVLTHFLNSDLSWNILSPHSRISADDFLLSQLPGVGKLLHAYFRTVVSSFATCKKEARLEGT